MMYEFCYLDESTCDGFTCKDLKSGKKAVKDKYKEWLKAEQKANWKRKKGSDLPHMKKEHFVKFNEMVAERSAWLWEFESEEEFNNGNYKIVKVFKDNELEELGWKILTEEDVVFL